MSSETETAAREASADFSDVDHGLSTRQLATVRGIPAALGEQDHGGGGVRLTSHEPLREHMDRVRKPLLKLDAVAGETGV